MQINFKKIFNWNILSVSNPIPVFSIVDFAKGQQKIAGYSVIVNYVHHGSRHFFFDANSERAWVMYGGAKEEAEDFYHKMLLKQKRQQIKKTGVFTNQR